MDDHMNYVDMLKQMPLSLALSNIAVIVDELAKIHNIDTMEMWNEMLKAAHNVYLEYGGVDYDI